jgi:hypothetical protein
MMAIFSALPHHACVGSVASSLPLMPGHHISVISLEP